MRCCCSQKDMYSMLTVVGLHNLYLRISKLLSGCLVSYVGYGMLCADEGERVIEETNRLRVPMEVCRERKTRKEDSSNWLVC